MNFLLFAILFFVLYWCAQNFQYTDAVVQEVEEKKTATLEQYKRKKQEYKVTIEVTSGTGSRGQHYVSRAYDDMLDTWELLEEEDKKKAGFPPKPQFVDDDGYGGTRKGREAVLRNYGGRGWD